MKLFRFVVNVAMHTMLDKGSIHMKTKFESQMFLHNCYQKIMVLIIDVSRLEKIL